MKELGKYGSITTGLVVAGSAFIAWLSYQLVGFEMTVLVMLILIHANTLMTKVYARTFMWLFEELAARKG